MSAILRDSDGKPLDGFNAELAHGGCCVCAGRADAIWMGESAIRICRDCAVRDLPRLIADAVFARFSRGRNHSHFEAQEREVLLSYWKGIAAAQSSAACQLRSIDRPAIASVDDGEDELEHKNGGS